MKALTVWQPWASLIIEGAKPYEFRGWRAPASIIGQRIVIHAATRKIDIAEAICIIRALVEGGEAAAETCLIADKAIPVLRRAIGPPNCSGFGRQRFDGRGDLPWACGLGTAIVGEPRNGLEIAEEFGLPRVNDSDRDQHANWGWPMLDIEQWDEPIPMKGAQGLWNWPTPEGSAL